MTAKKRALGRGLDALLKVPQASEAPRELPTDRLQPNRLQPREAFDEASLRELAHSIREQGILQPLVVTPEADGSYRILAGERRWRAARQAGLESVPVVVREVADDGARLEVALVENLQRSDLNPLEEAQAYRRLQEEFGLTQERIAARVGKSRAAVSNAVRLLKLPPEVLALLQEGRLTAGQARPLLSIADRAEQARLARQAATGGLSARDLEHRAGGRGAKGSARSRPQPPDADTAAAADRLTRALQSRVTIRRRRRGGTLCVAFHSEEELIRIYDMLMAAGDRR